MVQEISVYKLPEATVVVPTTARFSPYLVIVSRQPKNPDSGEADILREQTVIGTVESVRAYIAKYLAPDYDRKRWRWADSCFISKVKGGKIICIDYEATENVESIDALVMPTNI